jgi:hypothetical protein
MVLETIPIWLYPLYHIWSSSYWRNYGRFLLFVFIKEVFIQPIIEKAMFFHEIMHDSCNYSFKYSFFFFFAKFKYSYTTLTLNVC